MSKDKLNLIELKIGDELFSVLKEINSRTKIPLTKINKFGVPTLCSGTVKISCPIVCGAG